MNNDWQLTAYMLLCLNNAMAKEIIPVCTQFV